MGMCVSANEAIQTRQNDMMNDMMTQMVNIQHQQVTKQQQMIRDDPECKALMDKYTLLQKRALEAVGDTNASLQVQAEMMDLMKNPKMMKMIMPDMSVLKTVRRTQGGAFGATTTTTSTSTGGFGVGGFSGGGFGTTSAFNGGGGGFTSGGFSGNTNSGGFSPQNPPSQNPGFSGAYSGAVPYIPAAVPIGESSNGPSIFDSLGRTT